jgi:hypothetical protein
LATETGNLKSSLSRQASVAFNHILGPEATSSNSIIASSEGISPHPVNARKGLFDRRLVHIQRYVSDSKVLREREGDVCRSGFCQRS